MCARARGRAKGRSTVVGYHGSRVVRSRRRRPAAMAPCGDVGLGICNVSPRRAVVLPLRADAMDTAGHRRRVDLTIGVDQARRPRHRAGARAAPRDVHGGGAHAPVALAAAHRIRGRRRRSLRRLRGTRQQRAVHGQEHPAAPLPRRLRALAMVRDPNTDHLRRRRGEGCHRPSHDVLRARRLRRGELRRPPSRRHRGGRARGAPRASRALRRGSRRHRRRALRGNRRAELRVLPRATTAADANQAIGPRRGMAVWRYGRMVLARRRGSPRRVARGVHVARQDRGGGRDARGVFRRLQLLVRRVGGGGSIGPRGVRVRRRLARGARGIQRGAHRAVQVPAAVARRRPGVGIRAVARVPRRGLDAVRAARRVCGFMRDLRRRRRRTAVAFARG